MTAFITTALIGALIIVIGIMNMRGNISTIHSYHRNRVSPENVLPFGRLVGLGTIIIGIGCILFATSTLLNNSIVTFIGTAILIVTIVAGTAISFYAMKKYNGGIF